MTDLFRTTLRGPSTLKPHDAVRAPTLKDLTLPAEVSNHQDRHLLNVRLPEENAQFRVTDKLRPRVEFWKSIFTEYGEDDLVFHNRRYPWIVYSVRKVPAGAFESRTALDKARADTALEERKVIRERLGRLLHGEIISDADALLLRQFEALPGNLRTNLQFAAASTKTVDNIRFQVGHRERLNEAVTRAADYIPEMERIFASAGLPRELTRIPVFESGFQFEITSSASAVGPWQFLRGTAKQNAKLIVTGQIDERLDPLASTTGAARFLGQLREFFEPRLARLQTSSAGPDSDQWANDVWGFVTTGWNSGPGRVLSGMNALRSGDVAEVLERMDTKSFGFASRNFYAELLALIELEREGKVVFHATRQNAVPASDYSTVRPIALSKVLALSNLSFEEFQSLNPDVRSPKALLPAGYSFRLPSLREMSSLTSGGGVVKRAH